MAQETRERLTTEVIKVDPRKVKRLDINARFMRHEVFQRLKDNVADDGVLTQIPFGWHFHDDDTQTPQYDEDGEPVWEVLSGNHRIDAAEDAGFALIEMQVTRQYLTPDRRRAIQLSHNELSGEDDPATLRTIYTAISDVQMRLYTGLDDKKLDLLDDAAAGSLGEANLTFQTIQMVFLPDELTALQDAWTAAQEHITGSKEAWLARFAEYDAFLDALETAKLAYGVKNVATALMLVLEVFSRHLGDLNDGWYSEDGPRRKGARVPVVALFEREYIPGDVAAAVKKKMEQMRSEKEIDQPWQALKVWAEER